MRLGSWVTVAAYAENPKLDTRGTQCILVRVGLSGSLLAVGPRSPTVT